MLTQIQTYEQMPLLTYSLAVFYETLQMFPLVSISHIQEALCTCLTYRQVTCQIPKIPAEDTSFITTNIRSEKCIIPIPKDTDITISVPGLHYNRKAAYLPYHVIIFLYQTLAHYWEDPHAFKPSHFLEDWPHDAFLPFSSGKPFYKIG